jgi:hypothetical protein
MASKVDLVIEIGDVLTQIDALLSSPGLSPSDPNWQQLFALRKHLDDQQRELVREVLQDNTASFNAIAAQLSLAADALDKVGTDITKIGKILDTVSLVASLVDKILNAVA